MKKLLASLLACIIIIAGFAQPAVSLRPKLVVGIVVDQMRWDYLYRYSDRYAANGAFKRLLQDGFSCENTMIPYIHTVTACGHASLYTGTVPAIHGIIGNDWWDNQINNYQYCTTDAAEKTIGSNTVAAGAMSPRNMLTTTICDELKLATNFKSKVIGIALKDRGGILPAGHSANAAYWYDSKSGNWITSTYYSKELPPWVNGFNKNKLVDSFYAMGWKTLYPINTYTQSTEDNVPYENKVLGSGFPYTFTQLIGKNYNPVLATPHGNTLTTLFAKAIINNEDFGADNITDFLTISYSSPDYVGHSFGPNSVEQEDVFLRLDKELGELLDFLDNKIGKNQYLLFLSADHGAAHVPQFLNDNNIPAGSVKPQPLFDTLNVKLKEKFGRDDLINAIINYQVVLNNSLIDSLQLNKKEIKQWAIQYAMQQSGIINALDIETITQSPLNSSIKEKIINSYYPKRSGDIQLLYAPQWIDDFESTGSTHGVWNPYDSHIPLLWYGWNIKPGKSNNEVYITDIAPTLAALLKIQMPSGCTGKVIEDVVK
ncbi:alkaline phosphatase PafA [Ferruginibacter sp.]|nr:alkaline phosphatase family protein [Ferruginibacter sp.]